MQRGDFPYLLVGAAAAARHRARVAVRFGASAAELSVWPAARVWRSPLGAPLRRRTEDRSSALAAGGRAIVADSRRQAQDTVAEVIRKLGDEVVQSGLIEEIVARLLSSGAFDRIVPVIVNHPATEALVIDVLDDPALARLVTRVLESRFLDELTVQLIASDEMQRLIDYVMRSPELRAALTQQGAGLAGDMAAGVRSRTLVADDAAERFARSLIRRRKRTDLP